MTLFIYSAHDYMMLLPMHVDDIILIGSPHTPLSLLLTYEFVMKDLGPLHYFLGIEEQHFDSGIHLTQFKYINDILE